MTTLSRRDTFRFGAALAATSSGLRAIAPSTLAAAPIPTELILPTRQIKRMILSVDMADSRDTYVVGLWSGHDVIDATRLEYPRQRRMRFEGSETIDLVEAAVQRLITDVAQAIPLSTLTVPVYPKVENVYPTG